MARTLLFRLLFWVGLLALILLAFMWGGTGQHTPLERIKIPLFIVCCLFISIPAYLDPYLVMPQRFWAMLYSRDRDFFKATIRIGGALFFGLGLILLIAFLVSFFVSYV
jgi:hypothetical protein